MSDIKIPMPDFVILKNLLDSLSSDYESLSDDSKYWYDQLCPNINEKYNKVKSRQDYVKARFGNKK